MQKQKLWFVLILLKACVGGGGVSEPNTSTDAHLFECSTRDEANVKRVLILGDVVSYGYSPLVIQTLCNEGIYVEQVSTYIRNTDYVLDNLDTWFGEESWDLVIYSPGHADIPMMSLGGEHFMPALNKYKSNLQEIADRVLEKSEAFLFLTTTYVSPDCWYYATGDEATFNAEAVDVLSNIENATIVDMYWPSVDLRFEITPNGFHYSEIANQQFSEIVIEAARGELE